MDGNTFSRALINVRERPLSTDINELQSQLYRTIQDVWKAALSGRSSSADDSMLARNGFIADAFKVHAKGSPSLNVDVAAGLGFFWAPAGAASAIGGVSGLDDLSGFEPMYLSATQSFAVPTPPTAGQNRVDIIEAIPARLLTNPLSRDVLDPSTGIFTAQSLNKTLSFDAFGQVQTIGPSATPTKALVYKTGTAATAGSEVAPSTDTGYERIASILVTGGATEIDQNNIIDWRVLHVPGGLLEISGMFKIADDAGTVVQAEIYAPPGVEANFCNGALAGGQAYTYRFNIKLGDASRWKLMGAHASLYFDGRHDTPGEFIDTCYQVHLHEKASAAVNVTSGGSTPSPTLLDQKQLAGSSPFNGAKIPSPGPIAAGVGQPMFSLQMLPFVAGASGEGQWPNATIPGWISVSARFRRVS